MTDEPVIPLERPTHVLIVEDEQDERYALRALLESVRHRVEEAENGAGRIELALDRRPERGLTSLLRVGLGLLVVPLVVAGYAGLTALILPLVALRSVFPPRRRRQRLVDPAERVLPARPEPLPASVSSAVMASRPASHDVPLRPGASPIASSSA